MEVEQRALLQAWWTKSCHDLAAVRLLLAAEPPALDIAVYHCQQAAEKAIKTWLVWKDMPFPKTHDLEAMLKLCIPLDSGFASLMPHAHVLIPNAFENRTFLGAGGSPEISRWRQPPERIPKQPSPGWGGRDPIAPAGAEHVFCVIRWLTPPANFPRPCRAASSGFQLILV
jgi:HEPN domain